jgi:hypothetical protein
MAWFTFIKLVLFTKQHTSFAITFCHTYWLVQLNVPILYSNGKPTCKMVLNLVSMHTTRKSRHYTADTSLWKSLDSVVSTVIMLQAEHLGNHGSISAERIDFSCSILTSTGDQPASYTVGIGTSLSHGLDNGTRRLTTFSSSGKVKNVEAIPLLPPLPT